MECYFCGREGFPLILPVPVPDPKGGQSLISGFACPDCALHHTLACLLHGEPVPHVKLDENSHLCPECRQLLRKGLANYGPAVVQALVRYLPNRHLTVLHKWAEEGCLSDPTPDRAMFGAVIDYALHQSLSLENALLAICLGGSALPLLPQAWHDQLDVYD